MWRRLVPAASAPGPGSPRGGTLALRGLRGESSLAEAPQGFDLPRGSSALVGPPGATRTLSRRRLRGALPRTGGDLARGVAEVGCETSSLAVGPESAFRIPRLAPRSRQGTDARSTLDRRGRRRVRLRTSSRRRHGRGCRRAGDVRRAPSRGPRPALAGGRGALSCLRLAQCGALIRGRLPPGPPPPAPAPASGAARSLAAGFGVGRLGARWNAGRGVEVESSREPREGATRRAGRESQRPSSRRRRHGWRRHGPGSPSAPGLCREHLPAMTMRTGRVGGVYPAAPSPRSSPVRPGNFSTA